MQDLEAPLMEQCLQLADQVELWNEADPALARLGRAAGDQDPTGAILTSANISGARLEIVDLQNRRGQE